MLSCRYKGGKEFYRYVQRDQPPIQVFPVEGVAVEVSLLKKDRLRVFDHPDPGARGDTVGPEPPLSESASNGLLVYASRMDPFLPLFLFSPSQPPPLPLLNATGIKDALDIEERHGVIVWGGWW